MGSSGKSACALLLLVALLHAGIGGAEKKPDAPKKECSREGFHLVQQSYSTGMSSIVSITGTKVDSPIAVQVLENGKPAAGARVDFMLTDAPSGAAGAELSADHAVTDRKGVASVEFTAGDKEGSYVVTALLDGSLQKAAPLQTHIQAMSGAWALFLVFGLLGGLGLFLYGMNIASDNLQRAFGQQMRVLIGKLTRNRVSALLVGMAASGVLQSSSAATVMLVGFVSAGMMTLTQAIGVTMGTKVGVTITVQVIAFDISRYSLLVVGLGALLVMFAGRKERLKQIGAILLGFGLIFFGLSIMSGAMKPLRGMPEVAALMITFKDSALLALLAGTAVTAVIQSSTAIVAICFVLASQGLLSLEAAIPLAMGGAVGTCTTALLASLGSNRDGKRVAVAHLIFSTAAALAMYPFLGPLTELTRWFTGLMGTDSIIRQIANGFMLFSAITSLVFLPFIRPIEWLTRKIIPASKEEEPFGPKFINEAALQVPLMALDQAQKEVERMAGLFGQCLGAAVPAILDGNREELKRLAAETEKLDVLESAIRPFLTRLAQKGLSEADAGRERAMVYITENFEGAGHLLAREVLETGDLLASRKYKFTEQGADELRSYHEKLMKKFERVLAAVRDRDRAGAEEVLQLSFKEGQLERRLRDSHLNRLNTGATGTVEMSADKLTILGGLNAIRVKLDGVAEEILQEL
ncbi:MAG: Na/Pi symporter [Pseudomonadota bacterium]